MSKIFLCAAALSVLAAVCAYADHCADRFHYGTGTAGSGGFTPNLVTSGGDPKIGNSNFAVNVEQGLGGASGLLFVALTQGGSSLPQFGVDLLVLPPWIATNVTLDNDGLPGQGTTTLPMAIPDDPSLVGLPLFLQVILVDAGASKGFAASDGLNFEVCDGH